MISSKSKIACLTIVTLFICVLSSCVKFPDRRRGTEGKEGYPAIFKYPFKDEVKDIKAEIIIETDGTANLNLTTTDIPPLKYNKSWLLMLTQDDCRQDAFSSTWAAINGKPMSYRYFYDIAHLLANDLPPDLVKTGKTLGSTDGTGKEVRFTFTTTLAPQWSWMDAKSEVNKIETTNLYRFFMKTGLVWSNVIEMLNYGISVAFHDVNTKAVDNRDSVVHHLNISQNIIIERLSGRGCKVLAEPNGNKTYLAAGNDFSPIKIMTAQTGAEAIYPFKVNNDLYKKVVNRVFYNQNSLKSEIDRVLRLSKTDRPIVHAGVHGTGMDWASFLLWLNNTHGKDGSDSLWMTSLEEYYEYNYYRLNGNISKSVSGNSVRLTIDIPMEQYFYYPSLTINVKGLTKNQVISLTSSEQITGISYGDYAGGLMINIDCRQFLTQLATHYVERYEKGKSEFTLLDARYFVEMLKESAGKQALLSRLK